jgi:hypothetical protein
MLVISSSGCAGALKAIAWAGKHAAKPGAAVAVVRAVPVVAKPVAVKAVVHATPVVPKPMVAKPTVHVAPVLKIQQARILRINTVFDLIHNGQKGLLIQFDVDVDNLMGQEVNFAAYFYHANGNQLKIDAFAPSAFRTPDGQVTTQCRGVPRGNAGDFNVDLFIPYVELDGGRPGRLELMYYVEIQHIDGTTNRNLSRSLNSTFSLTTH